MPPTVREIGDKFGISSTNGVRSILAALIKKGYIRRAPRLSRGIEILESTHSPQREPETKNLKEKDLNLLIMKIGNEDNDTLKNIADTLVNKYSNMFILFANINQENINFIARSNSLVCS